MASDRISIFDFVLPVTIPRKGEVLTALTHFWLMNVLKGIPDHLVSDMEASNFNRVIEFGQLYPDIPIERTLVVRKLNMIPYEFVYRAHIGGSVWEKKYLQGKPVAGIQLPPGLTKWQQLEKPLFTPTTKSETGHDEDVTQAEFFAATGEVGREAEGLARSAYEQPYQYAKRRGIEILDTKLEIGVDESGNVVLADEVVTPDSSRFTTTEDLTAALKEGRDLIFYDKEPVRVWGKTVQTPFQDEEGKTIVGINKLKPENDEHVAFVHRLTVPVDVVQQCTERYLDIFQRLVVDDLETYQNKHLF